MISAELSNALVECFEPGVELRKLPLVQPGNGMTVFDIETGPSTLEHIQAIAGPFEGDPHPGEFDPAAVKVGNLKDKAKIDAKIEAARAAHQEKVEQHAASLATAEEKHWADMQEKAPLSPIFGRVLAIGFADVNENTHTLAVGSIHNDDAEADIIDEFWAKWFVGAVGAGTGLIGHNITGFDIPFLIRRSWILGVDVPRGVMDANWRYLSPTFLDTRSYWECGVRGNSSNCPGSLDVIGRVLGEGAKTEGMTGADFWPLFYSGEPEKVEAALAYLRNDVVLNVRIAKRIGVM